MPATLEDLAKVDGKAELVGGEIVPMAPTGDIPSTVAANIYRAIHAYAKETGRGRAYTDNIGYAVALPHRDSFSPDASFHAGPRSGAKFLQGAPVFAVEVRSAFDYGPPAMKAMAEKRADYFAAGTLVVWDVDCLRDQVVYVYRADAPSTPTLYLLGDVAEAEPALPGWRMATEAIFDIE
jgi:Uma2 family endonuclease